MESKSSKNCLICGQTKPAHNFPDTTRAISLKPNPNICKQCQTLIDQSNSDSDEGGGGKQNQHSRNARELQHAIELEKLLQENLDGLAAKKQQSSLFQRSQELINQSKTQATQREQLDDQEQALKIAQEEDEPNPEVSLNTQVRKKNVVHLFSVTRSLTQNRVAANNKNATVQKRFSLFAKMKEQLLTIKSSEKTDKANDKKTLAKESSTLFSQHSQHHPEKKVTEHLESLIREGQKIFKQ